MAEVFLPVYLSADRPPIVPVSKSSTEPALPLPDPFKAYKDAGSASWTQRFVNLDGEWWNQFIDAYLEYGDGAADELGLAGQWGDLFRKVRKLKPELWEGKEHLTRETARQVLMDIIGHAFLAIDMIDRGLPGGH